MGFYFDSLLWDLLGLLTTVIAVGYVFFWWKYQYWKRRNVPYLEPAIPWGNFENPLKRTMFLGDEIKLLYQQGKAKGSKYFGIYFLIQPNLVIVDLDLLKKIMTQDFNHFSDRGQYFNEKDDPLSAHLFALGGEKWKNIRSKLSPTFTSGKMKSMFSIVVGCGQVLETFLEGNIREGEGVDIKDILGKFTTDIIGSVAFGLDCNSFKDPNTPFRKYGKRFFELTGLDVFKVAFANSFPDFSRSIGVVTIPKEVTKFMREVVEDTINYRRKNNVFRNDFLQLVMEIVENNTATDDRGDGTTLTIDEAAAQCFVFFLGGFETSSTTMTFALYLLAEHQAMQDRVREEIKAVLTKYDGKLTYDSLFEMKYMKQVIDETLRLYPAVPFLNRMASDHYKIPGEDLVIEKGTSIFIPLLGIHYDEDYYENPEEFDPERFSEENRAKIPQYAHIPFGEGPRICIGERFGIMQTKVGLATILGKYKVTINNRTRKPLKLCNEPIVPSAEGEIWLNLEKL